jgi:hypothetical protein
MIVAWTKAGLLSPAGEERIQAFTELATTPIANVQARAAADEQAVLRRAATSSSRARHRVVGLVAVSRGP